MFKRHKIKPLPRHEFAPIEGSMGVRESPAGKGERCSACGNLEDLHLSVVRRRFRRSAA